MNVPILVLYRNGPDALRAKIPSQAKYVELGPGDQLDLDHTGRRVEVRYLRGDEEFQPNTIERMVRWAAAHDLALDHNDFLDLLRILNNWRPA